MQLHSVNTANRQDLPVLMMAKAPQCLENNVTYKPDNKDERSLFLHFLLQLLNREDVDFTEYAFRKTETGW